MKSRLPRLWLLLSCTLTCICTMAYVIKQAPIAQAIANANLLVNTEAFNVIDDRDNAANVILRFGNGLQKALTYQRTEGQFRFNDDLEVLGTISGSTLDLTGSEDTEFITLTDSTNNDSVGLHTGSGDPNAVVTGQLGSLYMDHSTGKVYRNNNGGTQWVEFTTGSGSTTHMAKMEASTAQTITTNTTTMIEFDTEVYDVGGIADTSTEQFTIQRAGKYLVTGAVGPSNIADGKISTGFIYVNSSEVIAVTTPSAFTNDDPITQIATVLDLAAGDTVDLRFQHRHGSDRDTIVGTYKPRMSVVQIDGGTGIWTSEASNAEYAGTASAATLHAQDLLTTSGALVIEEGKTFSINGVSYTFPSFDGSASGKVLATDSAGQLSWTDGGGSAGGANTNVQFNESNDFGGDDEFTWNTTTKMLEVQGTASGTHVHAQDRLTSSGTLILDSTFRMQTPTDSLTAFQVFDADGGNPVFIIDSTNENAGIGTASPGADFDVRKTTAGDVSLKVQNDDTGSTSRSVLKLQNAGDGAGDSAVVFTVFDENDWSVGVDNSDSDKFKISNSTTLGTLDRLTISSGNVGIATASPETKLEVIGTISGSLLDLTNTEDSEFITLTDSTNGDSVGVFVGSGSPEAVVTAQLGSIYSDHASGKVYRKNSDGGNTNWIEFKTGSGTNHMAKMTRDAAQSIPNNTIRRIYFDNVVYDVGGITTQDGDGGGDDRFDIKRSGKYLVTASYEAEGMDAGEGSALWIYKNGSSWLESVKVPGASSNMSNTISDVIDLKSGDYIELFVWQNEGVAHNTFTGDDNKPRMTVTQLDGGSGIWNSEGSNAEYSGTASGWRLHAQDLLTSSGGLLVEGTDIYFNGLDCSGNQNGGKLTVGSDGQVTCDDDGGGAAGLVDHYVNAGGDTMTGTLIMNQDTDALSFDIDSEATSNAAVRIDIAGDSDSPHVLFGEGGTFDTNLFRQAANVLYTDDSFWVGGTASGAALSVAGGNTTVSTDGTAIFNIFENAINFRIATSGEANTFFVHGTNNNVGIGTSSPETKLEVVGTMSGSALDLTGAEDTEFITLTDSTNGDSMGIFAGSGTPEGVVSAQLGSIYSDHANGSVYRKRRDDGANTGWEELKTGSGGNHMARLTREAAQSIGTGWDKVEFDNEDYDIGGLGDEVTNDRFDIQRTGKYLLEAYTSLNGLDDGEAYATAFYLNGAQHTLNRVTVPLNSSRVGENHTEVIELTAGDYLELYIYNGDNVAINTETGVEKPRMTVTQIDGGDGIWTSEGGNAEYAGIASGTHLHAQDLLTTSGSLIVEGTMSGVTLKANDINGSTSASSGALMVGQGVNAPIWKDPTGAMIWYLDGDIATGTNQGASVIMPFGFTVTGIDLDIKTAPSGSSLIIDINEAGSTIFSTNAEIDSGATEEDGNEAFSDTELAAGSRITLDVDQVGSSTAGNGLSVILKGTRKY